MAYTLQEFCRDTRDHLKQGASRVVLEHVKSDMERLLQDEAFIKSCFAESAGTGLRRIYADPELGFEVLAYRWHTARRSQPHDHGDSWAIYGQAHQYTEMTEYERTDDGSDPERATLKVRSRYRLNPGQAGIYFGRELHSTATPVGACYLRITGTDLEQIPRIRIDTASGRVFVIHGRQVSPAAG